MNIPNIDSITRSLAKEEEALFESATVLGTKKAIEEYLASAMPDLDKRLSFDTSPSEIAELLLMSAEKYVNGRDSGITTEEIDRSIRENALDENNSDPVSYLSSIILVQNLSRGRYRNMSRDEIILEYNRLRSFDPSLSTREMIEALLKNISSKNLCIFQSESTDEPLSNTALRPYLDELPDETRYAVRSAVFYAAALKGDIPDVDPDIHPALFSAFICGFSDAAAIVDKEMRGEYGKLEAEELLNRVGRSIAGLLVFLLFIGLILGLPIGIMAIIFGFFELETAGTIIVTVLVMLGVQLPSCLIWEDLHTFKIPEILSRIEKYRKYPLLPEKQQSEADFIKRAVPFITNKNSNTV